MKLLTNITVTHYGIQKQKGSYLKRHAFVSKLFIVVKAQVGNKQILYLNLVRYFPLISSVPYCALYTFKPEQ